MLLNAQLHPVWVDEYNGYWVDEAKAIAVDSEGAVYVAGTSFFGRNDFDYLTIKYNSNGQRIWWTNYTTDAVLSDDRPTCILVGPDDSVYVGGDSGIVRYYASGHLAWGTILFHTKAIALDSGGNLYATGRYLGTNGFDYATSKFDANGNQVWLRHYNGEANADDLPCGIGLDEQGYIYVSGDFTTLKYDSNGQLLWVARHDGGIERAFAMAVDPFGFVYVAGFSRNYDSEGDYLVVKFDSEGRKLWTASHNPYRPWACSPRALAVDKGGNVWVTGFCGAAGTVLFDAEGRKVWEANASGGSIIIDEGGNAYVPASDGPTKIGPNGQVLWKGSFPASSLRSLALGNGSKIYAAGDNGYAIYAAGYDQSIPVSNTPPFVVVTAPRNSAIHAVPAAIPVHAFAGDSDGRIARVDFLAGTSRLCSLTNPPYTFTWSNSIPGNYLIAAEAMDDRGLVSRSSPVRVKVNARNRQPSVSLTEPVARRFMARAQIPLAATASDVDGVVRSVEFYQGTNLLGVRTAVPYSMVWTNVGVGRYSLRAVAEDDRGGRRASRPVAVVVRSQFLGPVEEEWLVHHNGAKRNHDVPAAMCLDASGQIYVTGLADGGDIGTLKYAPDGTLLWSRTYDGPTKNGDEGKAVAVDSSGNVVVGGLSFSPTNFNDFTVIKYDSTGNELWVRTYQSPFSADDEISAVSTDSAGNVYVTGPSAAPNLRADYLTIKYDSSGNQNWFRRYDGDIHQMDVPFAVAVDAAGVVYVTGRSLVQDGGFDMVTIAYSPDGTPLWTRRFGGAGEDTGLGITFNSAGNLVVIGITDSTSRRPRFGTVTYTADGQELDWATARIPGLSLVQLRTFCFDATGALSIGGETVSPTGKEDFVTAMFTPRKGLAWLARYNGLDDGSDGVRAMAADGQGNLFVSGYSYVNGGMDVITIKYRPKSGVRRGASQ